MTAPVRAIAGLIGALSLATPTIDRTEATGSFAAGAGARTAELQTGGAVLTLPSQAAAMILVPRSTFTMGSTEDEVAAVLAECQSRAPGHRCEPTRFSDEIPERTITLGAYWLDRFEVTVAEYARCVAMSRCNPLPLGDGARRFDRPTYPASLVTWDEARTYCEFRGARLPTEEEFERAARGTTGRKYPWGNLYNSRVSNHGAYDWNDPAAMAGGNPTDARDGFVELAPVGSFPAGRTPEGFQDLAGNVAEWIDDRYVPRRDEGGAPDSATRRMVAVGSTRVVRGGSYETGPVSLRGAARDEAPPNMRRPSIGFRCAKSHVEAPDPPG
jgi:formylglycine-generating enzyme required for sulfatase activity